LFKFALRSSYSRSCAAGDFAQVELFVSVAIEKGKDRPSALPEKDFGEHSNDPYPLQVQLYLLWVQTASWILDSLGLTESTKIERSGLLSLSGLFAIVFPHPAQHTCSTVVPKQDYFSPNGSSLSDVSC
jgi:hypothetical protein